MKITKQQLQQIIKEELDAFLNEAFDDDEMTMKKVWQKKSIPPFSRANMFIRSADPSEYGPNFDRVDVEVETYEIAKALVQQMVNDKNLPKHKYIDKVLAYMSKDFDLDIWKNFAEHPNIPMQIEKLKKAVPEQIKAVELFEKYQKTLKALLFSRNELVRKVADTSPDLKSIADTIPGFYDKDVDDTKEKGKK